MQGDKELNLSTGGVVVNICPLSDGTQRLEVIDRSYPNDPYTCVEVSSEYDIQFGDTVWWQSGKVMWSRENEFTDRQIPKLSFTYKMEKP